MLNTEKTTPSLSSSSTIAKASDGLASTVGLLTEYFSKFDGSPEAFGNVQSVIPSLMHPNMTIAVLDPMKGTDRDIPYDEFLQTLENFSYGGGIANLEDVFVGESSITMRTTNIFPVGPPSTTLQTAYLQDGKIIRVHAIPPDSIEFASVMERARTL